MLPAGFGSARSVVGVAEDLFSSLEGGNAERQPVRSVVLVLIDGLGALPLRAHAGHAWHITAGMGRKETALSVFPTTTAAALTSAYTGVWPGQHGLVGYQVRDPSRDVLLNLLNGWEKDRKADPAHWQPRPTVFERAAQEGRPVFAVGTPEYAGSGFSQATLRGAHYVAERGASDRVARAYELAADHPGAFVSCYLPETDKAGHKHGIASDAWIQALETVDAALARPVPEGVGVLITADHGMIDVPEHRHVVLEAGDARLAGVRHIAGEPRMLHVYLEPDAAPSAAAETWRTETGRAGDVVTKAEAVASGLLGPEVSEEAAARIGDLLVVARGTHAFYDARAADQRGRTMVGQHGALTPEELIVPYLRRGAFTD